MVAWHHRHASSRHDGLGLTLVAHGPTAEEGSERKWQEISEGRMIVAAEAVHVHGLLGLRLVTHGPAAGTKIVAQNCRFSWGG
jgi:hypothetical protein